MAPPWPVGRNGETQTTVEIHITLRILTPPMETPDPPNDTPGALKQVVLTPQDIPRIHRVTS